MRKWEIRIVSSDELAALNRDLAELGRQGWEPVNAFSTVFAGGHYAPMFSVLMRREIP